MKRREQNEAQEARAERSKERRKRQAELQEQERLLKLQKLNEPGVPLADLASEIVEIESLDTSEAEQVQEETVDLQPGKQVTHDCSTQTEAFDHLYRSVASLSVKDCPRTDASTQTEEFDYLFTHSSTSKPFDQNYFRDDNAKVSFILHRPANIRSAGSHFYSCFTFCQTSNTVPLLISRDDHGSHEIKTKCSTPRLGL